MSRRMFSSYAYKLWFVELAYQHKMHHDSARRSWAKAKLRRQLQTGRGDWLEVKRRGTNMPKQSPRRA